MDSVRIERPEGIVFSGIISWSDSTLMPQVLLFGPRYDSVNPLLAGNFELEILTDRGYQAISFKGFYNFPPLKEFVEAIKYFQKKRFEAIVPFTSFQSFGKYRIRVRVYSIKFGKNHEDLVSNWCYFDWNNKD